MFEYIAGRLDYVCPEYVTVESGGIGYLLIVANPFSYSGQVNEKIKLYVYHHVREDFIGLYGFNSREERKFFTKLINVTGIGPKGALAVLASGQVSHVVSAIEAENENYLIKFPGVGKKTARQMILDLKGKLKEFTNANDAKNNQETLIQAQKNNENLSEAMLALEALGYNRKELTKLSQNLNAFELSTEEYIKEALKMMLK